MGEKSKADKHTTNEALNAGKAQATQKIFKGEVNAYGFIHLNKGLREAWGITKSAKHPLTIELTAEGALIVRKA